MRLQNPSLRLGPRLNKLTDTDTVPAPEAPCLLDVLVIRPSVSVVSTLVSKLLQCVRKSASWPKLVRHVRLVLRCCAATHKEIGRVTSGSQFVADDQLTRKVDSHKVQRLAQERAVAIHCLTFALRLAGKFESNLWIKGVWTLRVGLPFVTR